MKIVFHSHDNDIYLQSLSDLPWLDAYLDEINLHHFQHWYQQFTALFYPPWVAPKTKMHPIGPMKCSIKCWGRGFMQTPWPGPSSSLYGVRAHCLTKKQKFNKYSRSKILDSYAIAISRPSTHYAMLFHAVLLLYKPSHTHSTIRMCLHQNESHSVPDKFTCSLSAGCSLVANSPMQWLTLPY